MSGKKVAVPRQKGFADMFSKSSDDDLCEDIWGGVSFIITAKKLKSMIRN